MYREKIEAYMAEHTQEMVEDICELCRINSERMPAEEDMPFGPGAARMPGCSPGYGRGIWL